MPEQVVKSKVLRKQTKERMAVFFTNCVTNVIEKAVSICVIIQQNWKVKKTTLFFHNMDQSFEHNGTGISYPKRWKALKRS